MDLAGFAAAIKGVAARCEADLAKECARVAANEYLAALYITTPVETGALRASERVRGVWGGGAHAEAIVAPNVIYDAFRNDGGTISVRRAKVLTNGSQFFGRHVTQRGSHYMERAEGEAESTIPAACQIVLDRFISL